MSLLGIGAIGALGYGIHKSGVLNSVHDYLSGYTSAKASNRFVKANMALQQEYNKENMAREDDYQRKLIRDSSSLQRAGLEAAGFNPLLAVEGGISSPNSAVHASMPSASGPQVNSRFGDLVSGLGSLLSIGNSAADFMRLSNESRIADAQVESMKVDTALKSAKTLTEPSIKSNTDADTLKKKVNTITDVVGSVSPVASSAASAYAAKKSADVAKEGIKYGLTKSSATKIAKDLVGHSPATSALSAAGVLGLLGSTLLPSAGLGFGISNDIKTSKRMSSKDFKDWSNFRASSYGY